MSQLVPPFSAHGIIRGVRTQTIGQAVEVNSAMPITPRKTVSIAPAIERNVAMPITPVVASALLPLLDEAVAQLDRLTAFHAHPPPDHHDLVALYTEASLSLLALVVAIYVLLRRATA